MSTGRFAGSLALRLMRRTSRRFWLLPDDQQQDWETPCPKRDDSMYCVCWYDGDPCCACGDPADVNLR